MDTQASNHSKLNEGEKRKDNKKEMGLMGSKTRETVGPTEVNEVMRTNLKSRKYE